MDKNKLLIQLSDSKKCDFGKKDFLKQSEPQKVFSAIWALEAEVNNGGFSQYFFNSSRETVPFVVKALETIGAERTAELCRRAIQTAFPEGLPESPADIRGKAGRFSEELDAQLYLIDQEFYKYPDNLTDLLYDFVLKHEPEFGAIAKL